MKLTALRALLDKCVEDTEEYCNNRAARSLLNSINKYNNDNNLIKYIKNKIRDRAGQANGWEIQQQSKKLEKQGVSLESIVCIFSETECFFDENDKEIARRTLGIPTKKAG
jgi:hypothetical protein